MPGVDWRKSTAAFAGDFVLGEIMQPSQPQRFPDAGIVDDKRRNAPLRQRVGDAEQVDNLLGDVEPIEVNHARSIATGGLCSDEERRQCRILIRHFDTAAVAARIRQKARKAIERLAKRLLTRSKSGRCIRSVERNR